MIYSLTHVLTLIQAYILQLKKSVLGFKTEKDAQPERKIYTGKEIFSHVSISEFDLIFSSDKSLRKGPVYGDTIGTYVKVVEKVATAVLTDSYLNSDELTAIRTESYIRDIFVDQNGWFIRPVHEGAALRDQAIRLGDALALRAKNPDLGLHTYHNLITAKFILNDLDKFFMESCNGYYEFRVSRFRELHIW